MIKLCIFDLDGTLAKTQAAIARPVNMVLSHFGLPEQPVEAFNRFAGDGFAMTVRRALAASGDTEGRHFDEALPMCLRFAAEDPMYRVEPYEHMPEALGALKAGGVKLAVFTNKPHESAPYVIEKLFGKGLFDHVQGQCEAVPIKPDPSGVFEIMRLFGAAKDECLYFGDTNTDMLTARNAGVTSVGVTWGFRGRKELEESGADILIDDPSEIPGLAGLGV